MAESCFSMCDTIFLCSPLDWVKSVIITMLVESIVPVSSWCHMVPWTLQVNESSKEAFLNTKFCLEAVSEMICLQECVCLWERCKFCLLRQLGLWTILAEAGSYLILCRHLCVQSVLKCNSGADLLISGTLL